MSDKHNTVSFITLLKRLAGYMSGDSLNYLLGFVIYAWLIRSLSNQEYGYLSVATGIYQPFIVIVALGLDLIGPRVLAEHLEDLAYVVRRVQWLRLQFSLLVCLPILVAIGFGYSHAHESEVTIILFAAFSMILARAFDISYVAVALGRPKPLVYSRAMGLLFYLGMLLALRGTIAKYVWAIPVLNAIGVMVGRLLLMRWMNLQAFGRVDQRSLEHPSLRWSLLLSGTKTGMGQVILFATQSLDVVLLNKYVDAGVVGQYAMVSRLYIFAMAVLGCVLNAFIPELVASISHRTFWQRHRKFVCTSVAVGVIGGMVFYFLGPGLTQALGGRPLPVLHIVTPAYGLLFVVMSFVYPFISFLPSLQLETEYLTGVIIGAVTVFGFDMLLIPRVGVIGAAWGQLAGTVVLGFYSVYMLRRSMADRGMATLVEPQVSVGD